MFIIVPFQFFFLTELIFCNLLQVEGCDTVQNSFSPKTKKKEKKNGAMTSVSFDLPKINSVQTLCLSSYSPNRIYHTYVTLPKELGSWCLDNVIEFREFLLNVDLPTFSIACQASRFFPLFWWKLQQIQ